MTKRTYTAETIYGTFSRTSTRVYAFCVARADGWHQFSQSRAAAERELRYQQARGEKMGRTQPPVMVVVK